ncbi:TPA: hypothetical protein DIS56_02675 [Candidatus Saccharibacteria bacterium]|nr:MAG: hypothetical protein A3F05_02760 [Candidatus Saccharibacteria bacterium RIFCSPHIGHO2_12_FULL_47_17]HCM52015.1 hypothetical protein [Candidatus Saccharibacteria bacterium]
MKVDFSEVKKVFLTDHDINHGSNKYAMKCLIDANEQCNGRWIRRELNSIEVQRIVLPNHRSHNRKISNLPLVPETGLTVEDTLKRLNLLADYATKNPCCWNIIQRSRTSKSPVFLITQPLERNRDHSKLANFTGHRLYHLDGLHRLVAWGLNGRYVDRKYEPITAFIVGR